VKHELPSKPLCVHDGDKEAHAVLRWGRWLPLELNPLYRDSVTELRDAGRRVAQVTDLYSTDGLRLIRALLRHILAEAQARDVTDIVAVVSPRHARNYATLRFVDLRPDDAPRVWDLARDTEGDLLPTRLIRLALDAIPPDKLRKFVGGCDR